VCAETSPEGKLVLVSSLQQSGFTVGMVGDGINGELIIRSLSLFVCTWCVVQE
jgi:P-type E1-E2 ATPase